MKRFAHMRLVKSINHLHNTVFDSFQTIQSCNTSDRTILGVLCNGNRFIAANAGSWMFSNGNDT